jgi:hypothetical protein
VSDLSDRIQHLVDGGIRPIEVNEIRGLHVSPERRDSIVRRHPGLTGAGALLVSGVVFLMVTLILGNGHRPASIPTSHGKLGSKAVLVLDEAATAASKVSAGPLLSGEALDLSQSFLVRGFVRGASGEHFYYNVSGTGYYSLNADGTGSENIKLGSPTFPSSADEAAWRGLGSLVLVPSHQIIQALPSSPAESQSQAEENGLSAPPGLPTVIPYDEVATLPTNPAQLEQYLVSQYEDGHSDVGQTFDLAASLLEEGAGPAQRAALYKMVASLPGVSLDGPTLTDVNGKQGTGVSISNGGIRQELIFDPSTSSVLEERNIVDSNWPTSLPDPANESSGDTVGSQILAYTVFQGGSVAQS